MKDGDLKVRNASWVVVLAILIAALAMAPEAEARAGKKGAPAIRGAPTAAGPGHRELPDSGVVARVAPLEGGLFARLGGWSRWQFFRVPVSLQAGDEVRVLDGARAELTLPGRAALRTRGETRLLVRASELLMDRGFADVRALEQEPLLLATPGGELVARRARFSISVAAGDGTVRALVLSGVLTAGDGAGGRDILAGTGMELALAPGRKPEVRRSGVRLREQLERFSDSGRTPDFSSGGDAARAAAPETSAGEARTGAAFKGSKTGLRAGSSADNADDSNEPPSPAAAPQLRLRDRLRALRDPEERLRRYRLELAQHASAEREDFERGLSADRSSRTLLKEDVLARKRWGENRAERNLARGELAASVVRQQALYTDDQVRDRTLVRARERSLGRPFWLQTRQGVAETRAELARLESTVASLQAQLAAVPPGPSAASRIQTLSAQRDAALARANRVKDRIEELTEIQ